MRGRGSCRARAFLARRLGVGRLAVRDHVESRSAGAVVAVGAGREGRPFWRRRRRVVAVDEVVAGAAGNDVAAEVAEQRVVTGGAVDEVVAGPAGDDVAAEVAEQRVVTGGAVDAVGP